MRCALHALVVVFAASGCTTTLLSPARCHSNAECRSAFGLGHVCGTDGLCADLALPPRCTTLYPDDLFNVAATDPVVYGVLTDRSVPAEVIAERASRLVALLANQQQGLQNRTVGLVLCDVQSDDTGVYHDGLSRPDAVVACARTLTGDIGVRGVIGPHASSDVDRVFTEVLHDAPALAISPSATSAALIPIDRFPASEFTPGTLWTTVPPENDALTAMAASMATRAVPSIYIVAPEGVGETSVMLLRTAIMATSGSTTVTAGYYPPGSRPDMIDAINLAADASAPEVVYLGDSSSEAVTFLTLVAGDDRFATKTVFLNEPAAVPEILTPDAESRFGHGSVGYSLRIVHYVTPDSGALRNFRNQYRAEYMNQDPGPYAAGARAYDATWLMLFGSVGGLARTGDIDAQSIALGLRQLSTAGASPVDLEQATWRSAQMALMAGTTLNVTGASGDLDFDSRTEETSGTPEVLVVDGSPGSWGLVREP